MKFNHGLTRIIHEDFQKNTFCHSRMHLSGIQILGIVDSRLKRAGMTIMSSLRSLEIYPGR
jgi:hypothetical protein